MDGYHNKNTSGVFAVKGKIVLCPLWSSALYPMHYEVQSTGSTVVFHNALRFVQTPSFCQLGKNT